MTTNPSAINATSNMKALRAERAPSSAPPCKVSIWKRDRRHKDFIKDPRQGPCLADHAIRVPARARAHRNVRRHAARPVLPEATLVGPLSAPLRRSRTKRWSQVGPPAQCPLALHNVLHLRADEATLLENADRLPGRPLAKGFQPRYFGFQQACGTRRRHKEAWFRQLQPMLLPVSTLWLQRGA